VFGRLETLRRPLLVSLPHAVHVLQMTAVNDCPLILKQAWIDAEDKASGVSFELMCGAGVGNPLLILSVTVGDVTRWEHVDIRDVTVAWADQIADEIRNDKETASE